MVQLEKAQLLYLLYADAYSDGNSVTKSNVKSYLSQEIKTQADQIYNVLYQHKLIESPKKGRLVVTEQGQKVLVTNLQSTDYQFDTSKGAKVLNSLLRYLKIASTITLNSANSIAEEISFETFTEKFKDLYNQERKRQELHGVVAIYSQDICQKFVDSNPISLETLETYFAKLKSEGTIFAVVEKDREIIQWSE